MGSHEKQISEELDALRENVSALANELTGLLSDKGDEITGDVKMRVQRIRDDFNETISQTAAKGRELTQSANLEGLGETLENAIRERPFTMMAIAAGLGAVVASQLRR
jgi:ElaB/YqjD/DUF883 family membrane-anchored ribosome-binding protein